MLVNFYKTVAVPNVLYSSETWTLTGTNGKRIRTSEMKMLRRIQRSTRRDTTRNSEIEVTKLESIGISGKMVVNKLTKRMCGPLLTDLSASPLEDIFRVGN